MFVRVPLAAYVLIVFIRPVTATLTCMCAYVCVVTFALLINDIFVHNRTGACTLASNPQPIKAGMLTSVHFFDNLFRDNACPMF